jgi:hypothetical protein
VTNYNTENNPPPHPSTKRRTTLTLPADFLAKAERMARARKVTLSTVITDVLADGLRVTAAAAGSSEVLKSYKAAFAGFSDDEMAVLDGVIWDTSLSHKA